MAIMMVSVTDRTREIAYARRWVRPAGKILWQFLVEAATLTSIGGAIGILMGLGAGELLKLVLRMDSEVPLWSAALGGRRQHRHRPRVRALPRQPGGPDGSVEALRHE